MPTKRSKIETSPRKFSVPMEMFDCEPKHVQVSEMDSLAVKQKVTVSIKEIYVLSRETVKTQRAEETGLQCRGCFRCNEDGVLGDLCGNAS